LHHCLVTSYHIISVIYSVPITKWTKTIGALQKSAIAKMITITIIIINVFVQRHKVVTSTAALGTGSVPVRTGKRISPGEEESGITKVYRLLGVRSWLEFKFRLA